MKERERKTKWRPQTEEEKDKNLSLRTRCCGIDALSLPSPPLPRVVAQKLWVDKVFR